MPSALTLDAWLDHEDAWLAPGAVRNRDSRGRRYPEPAHEYRSPFQRDRERIVYSSSFRRMTGKTQVLVATVNDHHRTRLSDRLLEIQHQHTDVVVASSHFHLDHNYCTAWRSSSFAGRRGPCKMSPLNYGV